MLTRFAPLGLAILLAGVEAAAEPLPVLDRFSLSVGVFSNRLNLDGRVDGSVEFDGSSRDFDEDLGFGKTRRIDVWELAWRPATRHQIDLRRYGDSRSRTVQLDEELRFRGETFPIQADLRGRANFTATELDYTFWAWQREQAAVGVQLGLLRLETELGLFGRVASAEFGEAQGEATLDEHVYAPLFGAAGAWRLGTRWRLNAELRWIRLRINQIDGHALSAQFGAEFFPTEHVGLVFQYGDTRVEAERSKDAVTGRLKVGFSGPQVLLRLRF